MTETPLEKVYSGVVLSLWRHPPRVFEKRAYAHICDSFVLYRSPTGFILEFQEWINGFKPTYQALSLDRKPGAQDIRSLFSEHIRAGRVCFEMSDFDCLAAFRDPSTVKSKRACRNSEMDLFELGSRLWRLFIDREL